MTTPLDKLFENIEVEPSDNKESYSGIADMTFEFKCSEKVKKASQKLNGAMPVGYIVPAGNGKYVLVEINDSEKQK